MKTLTTFAFLAVMVAGIGAHASLLNEGKQNFYYYFGTPCSYGVAMASPCNTCCDGGTGLLGGRIIDGLL
ncbi:MAG: hypothetical protein K2X02_07200 [Alphaproteobacteria bacterium]|nr:hypothetical protein [Alphaproteobacteria bacterium]